MRRKALRALAVTGKSIGVGGVFVAAAVVGLSLHVNLGVTRKLVSNVANDALASVFQGRLVIANVEEVKLGARGHVRLGQVEITDPDGRRVILAKDIDARIDVNRLLGSLLSGSTPEVALESASIGDAEVVLDHDEKNGLGIARAFASRPDPTAKPKAAKAAGAESVRLSIENIYVHHAHVHGNVAPPALDTDGDELHARLVIREDVLTVDVSEVRATMRSPRAPKQTSDVHGKAYGVLHVPLAAPRNLDMRWNLDGDASAVPLVATFGLEKDHLTAKVDVAPVAPEVVRGGFAFLPLSRPITLHATADGEIGKALTLAANGSVGDAGFVATGELGLVGHQAFHVDADLTRVDGAAFTGPASDVSGHVHAEGELGGDGPNGTFTVASKEGMLAGQRAPAIDALGRFDAKNVEASFRATAPGVDANGEATLRIPEQKLSFDVRARSKDLRAITQTRGAVSGAGTAHGTGTIDLATSTIDAHVIADGTGVSHGPASAGSVHADATLTGPLTSPLIDVTAGVKQVRLAAQTAPGEEKKEPLTYPSATAHARIVLTPTPRILGATAHVDAPEHGTAIDASATEIAIGNGGVDVRGGKLTGLGAPLEADVQVQNGALSMRARGSDLDMNRVAAMTGIKQLRLLPEGTHANVDIDLRASAGRTDGHVDVSLTGAKDGTRAELHAKLDGRKLTGHGRVALGKMGWVEVQTDGLELPGGLDARSLERASGALDLRGEIDLSQGAALFGGERIEKISGTALLSARIERDDPRRLPVVRATACTRELDVTLNNEGKSTRISGVDVSVSVGYDAATDDTDVSLLTWDRKGVVVSADAKSQVPLVAWITGKKPLNLDTLGALEIAGVVDAPEREAADLPAMLARPELRGTVALHADIGGSVLKPRVALVARGENMVERRLEGVRGPRYAPIDATLQVRWNGTHLAATLTADEQERTERAAPRAASGAPPPKKREPGHVRGLVLAQVPVADLFAGRPLAWNASGEVDVADMELAPLPLPMSVRGVLTGRFKVRDLMTTPVLEAKASVEGLSVAGAKVALADVKVMAKDGSIDARAHVNQDDGGSGRFTIVSSALRWHGLDVDWNDALPSKVDYAVDRFRLSIVRPFVRRFIPEIDGQIDGKGSATIDADKQVFEGGIALTGGRLYVNAIGEEVTEVAAKANFERDGAFRIQDAVGKIGAGDLKASASGRVHGLHFVSADAVVVIPSKDGVPLSAEGAMYAQATGEVNLSARMSPDGKAMTVTVTVPRAKVTLPNRTTQNLQSLDPDETIAVGVRQPDGTLVKATLQPSVFGRTKAVAPDADAPAPSEPLVARFTVVLGNQVVLEGRGLKLELGGKTVVEIAEEIAVTGQISLKNGGTIDVQGRKFVVDHGTVTFVPGDNPSDPIVIAAAYWDAPDRTRVWVEFNGPLKTGKLTLRSEPPYSKNEILSVLLFGRADPNQAPSGDRPSDAQQATAVGTGVLSSGLNKALGELDEDFDLEQDRTSANRVRTKLGYRLRRNLKVELGYASGFSQREPDTTYLFLEWQFIPQWSLIGTRGDRGTSILDVLFQHRY